ncbi:hypothetical protein Tco_0694224 [Tanacetum coccineum]
MVVKSEILNDFPRFLDILIMEFAADGAVNFALKMERDMITENLDLEPKIDAMMRDFLDPSRWKKLSKETSRKILLGGDGSCRMTFKPIAGFVIKRFGT